MPNAIYFREGEVVRFNQLAIKIEMDAVEQDAYYHWLDARIADIGARIPGTEIAEKRNARSQPPLNTAIYYDTADHEILPTGALLRTSCNVITHAFCAFKAPESPAGVRDDHRYVFDGDEKQTIQRAPASPEAAAIVRALLARTDIRHPGTYLREQLGIDPTACTPAVLLESHRYTFFAWVDGQDALRCSIDRYFVQDLRRAEPRDKVPISEVELAVYPRIGEEAARDPRTVELIRVLAESLCETFGTRPTKRIKYQRSADALGIGGAATTEGAS